MANGRTAPMPAPDRALAFHTGGNGRYGRSVLILVEAKYLSSTSDSEREVNDDYHRTGNQLADQIRCLLDLRPDEVGRWFGLRAAPAIESRVHLFVTAHGVLPGLELQEANKHLTGVLLDAAYWLSWLTLHDHLPCSPETMDPGRSALIGDLRRLLEKKRLVPYRGFGSIRPWNPVPASPHFWTEAWWKAKIDVSGPRDLLA